MNILYLCADRGIPIRGHKGAAVHVRALIAAFDQLGHAVTLLTPRPGPADGPAPLARLLEVPLPEALDPAPEAQAQAYADRLTDAALAELRQHPYDLIYERHSLWSDAGARLTRITGVPLVLEVNAPLRLEASQFRTLTDEAAARRVEQAQFTAASALSVVSELMREYVVAQGASAERVHVLPNGVDPEHFHPGVRGGTVRGRWGLDERRVIGFVGRPRPWHDLETLLAALARLRAEDARYHLLLVGEMPEDLAARAAAHGLPADALTVTGPVPHTAVPEHIAAMDVAVSPHPDLAHFYFSPLKLFEYLACGVPTVAAAVGQPAQLVRHGETGYLYPPGEAAPLADHIRTLLDRPDHAREVAWAGACEVLTRYTWIGNARQVAGWVTPPAADPVAPAEASTPPVPLVLPLLDDKLRQRLYRATRLDLAGPLLARRLAPRRKLLPELTDIRVLKYKPGRRCVLAYTLTGRAGEQRVIGKVYRDERGERLRALQHYLWQTGFGPDAPDGIQVPEALAYVPEMRMLVQAQAAGATLNELAAQPEVAAVALAQRCAEGLAKLHATAPPALDLPMYDLAAELNSLTRFTAELTAQRPAAAPAVRALSERLTAWGQALPAPTRHTLVHRDFYYSQVLVDGPRLTLIDFDLLALGDPAIDVANFLAHLVLLGLDRLGGAEAWAEAGRAFLTAYTQLQPVPADFYSRLAFYEAATYFRLLNVVASRPGLAQHFDVLYQRAADCLPLAAA